MSSKSLKWGQRQTCLGNIQPWSNRQSVRLSDQEAQSMKSVNHSHLCCIGVHPCQQKEAHFLSPTLLYEAHSLSPAAESVFSCSFSKIYHVLGCKTNPIYSSTEFLFYCSFCLFESGSYPVVQAILEFTMYLRLSLNSYSECLWPLSGYVKSRWRK